MARLHSVTLNGKQCPWIRGAGQGIRSTWLLATKFQKQGHNKAILKDDAVDLEALQRNGPGCAGGS